jgi:hypothetical protein
VNIKCPRAGRARSPQENKVAGTANAEAGGQEYYLLGNDCGEMHDTCSDYGRATLWSAGYEAGSDRLVNGNPHVA